LIRARQNQPTITESELSIDQFSGLNTFGPHADLDPNELRNLVNMDIYSPSAVYAGSDSSRGYLKTRRGSNRLTNSFTGEFDIINHIVFDAGDVEFVVIQQDTDGDSLFKFHALNSYDSWSNVTEKSTGAPMKLYADGKVDWMMSNQKIYVFHTSGNSIIEYDSFDQQFVRRKMGLPAPQITSVTGATVGAPGTGLDGKRVYAVELVYKDTSVTPQVDLIVSGPNRAVKLASPTFKEGRLAYAEGTDQEYVIKVDAILNDGTGMESIANSNWTHARLYRSKDVTTATNAVPSLQGPAEIIGREDEMFLVQEIDKATFLATLVGDEYTFAADKVKDDDVLFPLDFVSGDRLDMTVLPGASIGTFHRNKIWVSGVKSIPGPNGSYALDAIESKIFFTPESNTKYSESSRALDSIESDPGDGEKMIKLISFKEDLLGIKQGKTGRVPYGDPNSGWITEDHVIGIENADFAQYVPNVGICAIVNDQQDFRIFGDDFKWHSDFAGMQVSRPIRDIIKTFDADDIDFFYMNGKLFISGGESQFLVLGVEQRRGWTTYEYPLNGLSEASFTFDEGRRAAIISRNAPIVEIEIDGTDYDFNTVNNTLQTIGYSFTTYKFQAEKGRSLVEQRWLSIVANLSTNLSCVPYVNGKLWSSPFTMLLDPQLYPEIALRETEYQGYNETKPIANYLHYVISGKAPATIYSIMLNCLIQRGQIRAGFDPFGILENVPTAPPWATGDIIKDAGDEDRDTSEYVQNDASDENRTISEFRQDDAGDENRE